MVWVRAGVLCLLSAAWLQAGWVIDEVTRYAGGEEFRQRLYIQEGRFKSENNDETVIVDLVKENVYFVYDHEKRYFGGRLSDVVAELRRSTMTEMNEEENLLDNPTGPLDAGVVLEVSKTGETLTLAGYKSEKYQVVVDGELKEELFISGALPVHKELDPLKLAEVMLRLGGVSTPSSKEFFQMAEGYNDLMKKGYPIRSIEYDPSGEVILNEIEKVEKRNIPASEFAPPKGYERINPADLYQRGDLL